MNDEDRLTYALQVVGPDEYPEAYYRALARAIIDGEYGEWTGFDDWSTS